MSASTNKYIDPLSDFGFKHLFGGEPNKEIMIAFLNALFEGEKHITDIVYNPTELAGDDREHKKACFDLLCTGDKGEQFIVEMQRAAHNNFEDRCIFYLSRLIHQQKLKRNWEVKLKEVFLVGILDFNMKNCLSNHFLQSISLVNTGTGKIFHNGLGFKFLELPKFGKKEDELETELDKWVYMLKHMHSLDQVPKYLDKRVFEKIFNIAEMDKLSPEQQFVYDSILQREEDDQYRLGYAEQKGREEGMEKGLGQGKEEGKHETALAIARKMKEENFELAKIAGFTALSIEEIESL
ncbi:Rpn family recombination-promoting nuclease/putative transposase [Pedobacter cryoconitis]|uniref:Rpn family recombination-promoting nuclease/putative transposase n=1 Tax=Pedobacter cryoconitis TaxID=188932 RepID=UPI00161818AA|nr:Rpn family recombination-promoting nuclease/putative transposase [Pedobacter cryoconitis]MBB5646361.1 putative transposase/invertase (TIGR01784 family) [Pedobacter cryoconitis]